MKKGHTACENLSYFAGKSKMTNFDTQHKSGYFVRNRYAPKSAAFLGEARTRGRSALTCTARSEGKAAAQRACSLNDNAPEDKTTEEGDSSVEEAIGDALRILLQDNEVRAVARPIA